MFNRGSDGGAMLIRIESNRILISFIYDADLVARVRDLPGRRFDPWSKNWTVPATPACAQSAVEFGRRYDFNVADEVVALAEQRPTEPPTERPIVLATALPDTIAAKLLPYQIPAVRQQLAAIATGASLDASDTGTGKTYVSLAVCATLNRPAFIVCPKPVIPSWQRAAKHFNLALAGIINYELLRRGEQPAVSKITDEKKRDVFTWHLPKDTIIIFDECHRMKDGKTQNNKMGMAALRQGYTVLGLSATAADNPMQMKFSGLLTGLFENEKRFWPWAMSHGVSQGRWGYQFNNSKKILDQIHREIFPRRGVRVRIADLGDAFPETQISAETYELNGAVKEIDKIYAEMSAELKRLAAKEVEDSDPNPLVIRLRARQKIELLKIPAIAEIAQDGIDSNMSVVVFVNFNESLDALRAKLKTDCVIRGGQSDAERESNIQKFQSDQTPIILANLKAGGVGISLHGSPEARTRLAIICPTDSGQDLKQALGRVHRAQGAKSIQRVFFAANTVEEKVCENVRRKIAQIDLINDGDLNA